MSIGHRYGWIDKESVQKMMIEANANKAIRGMLMAMEADADFKLPDNKQLYIVFGIIEDPEKIFKDLHQYPITGDANGSAKCDSVDMLLSISEGRDKTEETKGLGVNEILQAPVWRL